MQELLSLLSVANYTTFAHFLSPKFTVSSFSFPPHSMFAKRLIFAATLRPWLGDELSVHSRRKTSQNWEVWDFASIRATLLLPNALTHTKNRLEEVRGGELAELFKVRNSRSMPQPSRLNSVIFGRLTGLKQARSQKSELSWLNAPDHRCELGFGIRDSRNLGGCGEKEKKESKTLRSSLVFSCTYVFFFGRERNSFFRNAQVFLFGAWWSKLNLRNFRLLSSAS